MNSEGKISNPFEQIIIQLDRIESFLYTIVSKLDESRESSIQNPKDNSIQIAIKITGLKKKTIYNLVNRRLIPHSKRGKRLYFDETELETWIKNGKRKTKDELAAGV